MQVSFDFFTLFKLLLEISLRGVNLCFHNVHYLKKRLILLVQRLRPSVEQFLQLFANAFGFDGDGDLFLLFHALCERPRVVSVTSGVHTFIR